MPKKKIARKKRASLKATDLTPGVRFSYGAFYGRPSVGVEILRGPESGTGTAGLPRDRWWSKNLDTGEEGYIVLGPGGVLNVDEVLSMNKGTRQHAKKSPAQLDREIADALAHAPSSTARAHATIDTTETLDHKFRARQRDALTLAEKARQARGAAARWMKRSSAYARAGEFRQADEAETEAMALGRLADSLDADVSSLRTRSHATAHATAKQAPAYLFVEGVGHRLPHGYEIHWNWKAIRDGKQIDGGALSGGNIPEFYETWPDYRGVTAISKQMEKILRDEWIATGEFGTLKLSPKVRISVRKSGSEVPIRGR